MRMSKAVQYYFAYEFIKNLVKDFRNWDAYKAGLIDEDGNKIRDAENSEEERLLSPFANLVRKTKRLLSKVPGGRSLLSSVVAATLLLKEENGFGMIEHFDVTHLAEFFCQECQRVGLLEEASIGNYLYEDKLEPLVEGVYTNIAETEELYGGAHLFYVHEECLPMTDFPGLQIYRLRNSLQKPITIPRDHLRRVR